MYGGRECDGNLELSCFHVENCVFEQLHFVAVADDAAVVAAADVAVGVAVAAAAVVVDM